MRASHDARGGGSPRPSGVFEVHGRNRDLRHARKYRIVFAEPERELEQMPHGDGQRDGVDF